MNHDVFKRPVRRLIFNPEISLGHILQAIIIIVPSIVFFVRLEARVQVTETAINRLAFKSEQAEATTALLAQNQAVLAALFEVHRVASTKVLPAPKLKDNP
jgi:hypothetical protein